MTSQRRSALGLLALLTLKIPGLVRAQTGGRVHRIGVLSLNRAASPVAQFEATAVRAALHDAGYEVGRNLHVEVRYAEADAARLDGLAEELVRLDVALILAIANLPVEAAMRATRRIPIVMVSASLPVELGYVASLARPGGNVTGTAWATVEMSGKVLQILNEAAPRARRIALLATATAPGTQNYRVENRSAAQALGLTLQVFYLSTAEPLQATLQRVAASRPDALFVVGEGVIGTHLGDIVTFAAQRKLVAIGVTPQFIQAGGALYYGPNLNSLVARTVSYVDRILKGARPADLPVELPSKFDLIINLKALRAMGLTVPQALLLRADEVID